MAQVANGFRPASLASLLLHGGAVLALLAGLPPPAAPTLPQVIEMTFLPVSEPVVEPEPQAAAEAEPASAPEEPPEPPGASVAEAPPTEPEVAAEQPPEALAERADPTPAPTPEVPARQMPQPAPAPRPRTAAPRHPRPATPGPAAPPALASASVPSPQPAPAAPRAVPQSYIAALFAALDRRKEYPESARWRRAEGTAILRVALHRDGSVQAWRIERGSGHEDLDQAIGSMVRRASPLPAPPADLPGDPVEFSIPVRFSLR